MRIVADTNTGLSGLLWQGPPRQIINFAPAGDITLPTSRVLLASLPDVIGRSRKLNMPAAEHLSDETVAHPLLALGSGDAIERKGKMPICRSRLGCCGILQCFPGIG